MGFYRINGKRDDLMLPKVRIGGWQGVTQMP
jgi:hypothetical protein